MTSPVNIGIVCYASVGGSGVVATELGEGAGGTRQHRVHLVSSDMPFRLNEFHADLSFHQVHTPAYPLFREPQYVMSLANKLVQVRAAIRARHRPRALRDSARDGGVARAAGARIGRAARLAW